MIPISKELYSNINIFATPQGAKALEELGNALWMYYAAQCTETEGVQLHRNQGCAQLAAWLKTLPKGLTNGGSLPTPISNG